MGDSWFRCQQNTLKIEKKKLDTGPKSLGHTAKRLGDLWQNSSPILGLNWHFTWLMDGLGAPLLFFFPPSEVLHGFVNAKYTACHPIK